MLCAPNLQPAGLACLSLRITPAPCAPRLPCLAPQVRREKGIYHTLNKLSMDVTRKVGAVTAV